MSIEIINANNIEIFVSKKDDKRRLFITGASGSGKSTLWNCLDNNVNSNTALPCRYISRPYRPDDNLKENQHLNIIDFELLFNNRTIEFYWPKFLPESTEYYGFKFCEQDCIIYGCNNEFLLNIEHLKTNTDLFKKSIIVQIESSLEIRKKRLIERYKNQNIPENELMYRLDSNKNEKKILTQCDILIQNNEEILKTTTDLINLLSLNKY